MTESISRFSVRRLVLAPALISLGVTLFRLLGELSRWSEVFFSRQAGGPGALVGIVWLIPVFGIYFACKLAKAGRGPRSRGRAIGFAAGAVALFVGLFLGVASLPIPIVGRIALINLVSALCAFVACQGWPQLALTEFVYGLAARLPVALVMLAAMLGEWGTHYELGPPNFPPMSLFPRWLLIGLMPQLIYWIGFTVMVGSFFGSLALLFRKADQADSKTAGALV